jgi:hypothetical protein
MLSEIDASLVAFACKPATPAFRDEEIVIRHAFLRSALCLIVQ